MRRVAAVLFVLVASTPLAHAGYALMQVSVTVVNTCYFGAQARCRLPGTLMHTQAEPRAVDTGNGTTTAGRRVVHL